MEEISTDDAPPSIGPFSQAIRDGNRIYVSGQGPVDPETGEIVEGTIGEQTARTLENIDAVLQAAGRSLDDVVKATVFVQDMDDYDEINEVYADYVSSPYPARSAVQVEDLPIDIGARNRSRRERSRGRVMKSKEVMI
nr:Rid family detoxifying hydrolase [Haladaptatus sp. R4]